MSRVTCAAILAAGFIFLAGPAPAAEVTALMLASSPVTPGSNLLTMGR